MLRYLILTLTLINTLNAGLYLGLNTDVSNVSASEEYRDSTGSYNNRVIDTSASATGITIGYGYSDALSFEFQTSSQNDLHEKIIQVKYGFDLDNSDLYPYLLFGVSFSEVMSDSSAYGSNYVDEDTNAKRFGIGVSYPMVNWFDLNANVVFATKSINYNYDVKDTVDSRLILQVGITLHLIGDTHWDTEEDIENYQRADILKQEKYERTEALKNAHYEETDDFMQ